MIEQGAHYENQSIRGRINNRYYHVRSSWAKPGGMGKAFTLLWDRMAHGSQKFWYPTSHNLARIY
jgi:hypothetical protein